MVIQSRLNVLNEDCMDDAQRAVLDDILAGPRGNLDGPFLAWIHSPELAGHAQRLGAFCRYGTRLELRLTELAILFTASWWQSQAEWQIHEPIARSAGVSDAVIEALRQQVQPPFTHEDERLVFQLGKTLYDSRRIDEELYEQAISAFGEPAVVELVGVFGYYALVAMTLNVFAVRRVTDAPLPFIEP
ncbi:carboxymuconolactone decarboxylase family protein [Pseudomonas sp. CBSPBW29]|uniref:carboxymuconolactone decarboxylase family protein n=1 Tax=Pseudomonas sp. CBS TaxID=2971912 RepID=UPI0021ABFDC4|nr:carboxymuconolactone decarboxylase family protein [Pseudomonas sp. CBS]WEL43516.1 carboxymuconolactone decarboxylase family protein [Pseudomonas sp. CBSPBW29]WEL64583.1 carboxymuconolactone decarboxylase family protein [Pseudomonas sp. CBSPGW29]WEL68052.1 carboxymuconolactone decarboxylase family protein [Pseudomonas sp. CBSPCGW29]WEL75073.1 carboxymuconolactone decarboxylase family protein [Pseudomonas sp. CBSPAW29]WEL80680.1 carboxymuconolactone decarboxylase family protein [Pseudomonas s